MRGSPGRVAKLTTCGALLGAACAPELPQRLLDDTNAIVAFGPREYDSDGLRATADLLRTRLQAAGASVDMLEVPLPRFATTEASVSATSTGTGAPIPLAAPQVLAFTGDGDVDAPLLDAGDGRGGAYADVDAVGKVLLVRATATSNLLKIYDLAIARDAAGVLWESDEPHAQRRTAWKPDEHAQSRGPLPTASISGDDAAALRASLAQGGVTIALHVRGGVSSVRAPAVVARIPGLAHAGQAIVVDAHLDAWHNGANDNATGLAVLVELAQRAHARPLAYDIVLAAFPGQEVGFFGSSQFVRDAVGGDVRFAITIDMLAPVDPTLRLAAFDPFRSGSTPAPVLTAYTSTTMNDLFDLQMPASEMRTTAGGVNTDHSSFWDAGIPGIFLACLGWPGFHTEADTVDRIDVDRLVAVTEGLDDLLQALAALEPDELGARPSSWIPIDVSTPDAARAGQVTLGALGDGSTPVAGDVEVRALASDSTRTVVQEQELTPVQDDGYSYALGADADAATWLRIEASTSTSSGVRWMSLETR